MNPCARNEREPFWAGHLKGDGLAMKKLLVFLYTLKGDYIWFKLGLAF
ncbi:hypothetical protein SBDP1_800022 [Syntrophobacter sp. SbD1]|nr:hypothetical protein SBDP1_800022 [Syntrophobacter sp. SbD1]